MSKRYGGPLGWLRSWNSRRLEKRHWQRKVLEALAEDDAAIMESLSRMQDAARAAEAARAQQSVTLESQLADGLGRLGVSLTRIQSAPQTQQTRRLEQELTDQLTRLGASLVDAQAAAQAEQRLGLEAQMSDGIARLETMLNQRMAPPVAHAFPLIVTSREGLLDPELEVLTHIAPFLSSKVAIDVGAHHGKFSAVLLDLGFEVHALEPNPSVLAELQRNLEGRLGLTIHPVAAGSEEGEAELGLVSAPGLSLDPSTLGSVAGLPVPAGLVRADIIRVPLRRLDNLVRQCGLAQPSLIKVDTEGYDLEVLRGLGDLWPDVLQAEFWDDDFPWSAPGSKNRLPDLVAHARLRGAAFHLVLFRRWGEDRPAFFANYASSPERSWGNVIFFRDRALFETARQHLTTLLPEARFVAALEG